MEQYKCFLNIKWKEITIGKAPKDELVKDTNIDENDFDAVKNIFKNGIINNNPEIIKDVFITIISRFKKTWELDQIFIKIKEENWQIHYWMEINDDIKTHSLFSVKKENEKNGITNIVTNFFGNEENTDDESLIMYSMFVFAWVSDEYVQENAESALAKWFANFLDLLDVKIVNNDEI